MTKPYRPRYAAKPTHCMATPGCANPCHPPLIPHRHYICRECRNRIAKEARQRRSTSYHGPCMSCGVGTARRRSGFCKRCYLRMLSRRQRRHRALTAVLGDLVPLDWILRFPDDARARDYMLRMVRAITEGQLVVSATNKRVDAVNRRWRKKAA